MKVGLAALLIAATMAVHAGDDSADAQIQRARDFAFRGNHPSAFAILRPLAEQGNAEAQYTLAKIQLQPYWRDRDPADGKKWLIKAAELGHVNAQFQLAFFYAMEEKNYAEALKGYLKFIELHPDDPSARAAGENLGVMYAYGQGVPKDYVEAMRWNRFSAERGSPLAQYRLGMLYMDGLAGAKDFDAAIKWLSTAAKQGFGPASYTLIFIYAEGFDTQPNVVEAAYWYMGKRFSDEAEAAYYVGRFYSRGFMAEPNAEVALLWLYKRRGVAEEPTIKYLGRIHLQIWNDEDGAEHWFRIAAEGGFVGGQVDLAGLLWNKNSKYWNCAEAAKWTRLAADKSDTTAMVNMGIYYLQGPPERVVNMIGLEMEQTEKGIQVRRVEKGGPAETAGIRPDDLILDVDGEDVGKLGVWGIVDSVRSAKSKAIALHIRRGREKKPRSFNVMPKEIHQACPGAESAGLKRDPEEAVKWFKKAADSGDLSGLFLLAEAYQKGTGVPQDFSKAKELYEEGASRGDWEAAQAISHMYFNGEAGEKDKELGERWFRKALDLKHKAVRRGN